MSDLTPARLAKLRAVAEAALTDHGNWSDNLRASEACSLAFRPPTVLALLEEIERLRAADLDAIGKRGERLAEALIGKRRAEQERNDAQELLRRAHRLTSAEGIADWKDMAAPHIEAARQRRNG